MTTHELPQNVNPDDAGLTIERIEAIAADEYADPEKRELAKRLLTAEAFLKVVCGGGSSTSHHFVSSTGKRILMTPVELAACSFSSARPEQD